MDNDKTKYIATWQTAYLARELRKRKKVTLSCLKTEAGSLLEQLGSFSNSSPVLSQSTLKPNSNEMFVEIVDVI